MGALPASGFLSEMSMKWTELITGMGGEQDLWDCKSAVPALYRPCTAP